MSEEGYPYLDSPRYFTMGSGDSIITIVCTRKDELTWYECETDLFTPISRDEYNAIQARWQRINEMRYGIGQLTGVSRG